MRLKNPWVQSGVWVLVLLLALVIHFPISWLISGLFLWGVINFFRALLGSEEPKPTPVRTQREAVLGTVEPPSERHGHKPPTAL